MSLSFPRIVFEDRTSTSRWSKFELHELHIFAAAVSEFGPHDPTDPVLSDLASEIDDELTRRQR